MLVLTRAVVALSQPEGKGKQEPQAEQLMFLRYALHLQEQYNLLKVKEAPSATAPSPSASSKVDPTARYTPSRWLLMSCYEAVHSDEYMSPARREALTIALFARVTGNETLEASNAERKLALYNEAAAIHRCAGRIVAARPSRTKTDVAERGKLLKHLDKWLLGTPDTVAANSGGRSKLLGKARQESDRAAARPHRRPATAGPRLASPSTGSRGPPSNAELAVIAFYRGQ